MNLLEIIGRRFIRTIVNIPYHTRELFPDRYENLILVKNSGLGDIVYVLETDRKKGVRKSNIKRSTGEILSANKYGFEHLTRLKNTLEA